MDQLEPQIGSKRTGILIVVLLIFGVSILGAGGYIAWSKRRSPPTVTASDEVQQWCKLRQEWAKEVVPIGADIMLKSIRPEDKEELETLMEKRSQLIQQYAKQVRELTVTDPAIQAVEVALIKEGKIRANVSVEIANVEGQLGAEDMATLNRAAKTIKTRLVARIKDGQKKADQEIKDAMATLTGGCSRIYRGPMTDENTADDPYVSWDELEMKRSVVERKIQNKLMDLKPLEEFTNRVYHELVRLYRPTMVGCYKKIKSRNAELSEVLDLRIRLKNNGQVKTLAIQWMENKDERLVDCFLEKASRWRLPRPDPETQVVVVTLDFSSM